MKPPHLLLIGVAVFLFALIVHTPITAIYGWTIAKQAGLPVKLYGIEGSPFSGHATQINYGTQIAARNIRWTFAPAELLRARIGYHVSADGSPLLLDGKLSTGLGGSRLTDAKASGELRVLAALAGQAFVPVNGQLGAGLEELVLRNGWPVSANGQVQLLGLAWTLGRDPVPFGDYEARIERDGDDIVARVSTLRGVVEVGGEARVMPDRRYNVNMKLRPRGDAPPLINNLLSQLGRPDADGFYRLTSGATIQAPASGEQPINPVQQQPTPAPTEQSSGAGTGMLPR